jgi:hypothetical protein
MKTPTMAHRVEEYLAYRRALGYRLKIEGQMLQSFARYADESGHRGPLTTELALRWARLPERRTRLYQARRLEVVRTLARYLAAREPGTPRRSPNASDASRARKTSSCLLTGQWARTRRATAHRSRRIFRAGLCPLYSRRRCPA